MKNYINGIYGKKLSYICMENSYAADYTFDRYECYVQKIHKNERLGFQLVPDKEGVNLFVVSDSKDVLDHDGISWILKGYAQISNGAPVRASFTNSKRRLYVLAKCRNCDESCPNFEYSYLEDLLDELKNTGIRLQMRAGIGSSNGGCIFLSAPGEISIKMKAILSMVFKDLELKPFTDKSKTGYILPNKHIDRYISSVLCKMNYASSGKKTVNEDEDFDTDDDEDMLEDLDLCEPFVEMFPEREEIIDKNPLIEAMGFSIRTYNCLKRAGISDLKALRNLSKVDLSSIRNLGKTGVKEVEDKLAQYPAPAQTEASEEKPEPLTHMQELDNLIGLENVKEQVRKIAAYARMKKAMAVSGNDNLSMALNTEFTGNPGTAKTTVARVLAGIFYEIGLLESDEVVEVGRSDLIASYVGQTAPKVRDVFKRADGKLLFIDEAYSLVDTCRNDYGDEAIDTIVQEMENRRDRTIVIFAGYPDRMAEFFECNPGLRSRVPFSISFSDYPVETLVKITESEASKRGFAITADAISRVNSLCAEASSQSEFGNGRFCRNLIENAILNFASRNFSSETANAMPETMDLIADDFAMPTLAKKTKPAKKFGFV